MVAACVVKAVVCRLWVAICVVFIAGGLCYAGAIGLITIAALGSLCGLDGCLLLRFDCAWWFGGVG